MYLRYLHDCLPPPTKLEEFAMGYQDFLQTPLQPLEFNLESATYEIFEKDPVKYGNYEKAIELALRDRPGDRKMYAALTIEILMMQSRCRCRCWSRPPSRSSSKSC